MAIAARPATELKSAVEKKAAAIAEKPVTELNVAEANERADETAAFWAEKKAWLEEVAATVQKATVERAMASSGIPHESKMATPQAEAGIAIASIGAQDGDCKDGKDNGVRDGSAIDLSQDGECDSP